MIIGSAFVHRHRRPLPCRVRRDPRR
jgi:hypothetical protein